jgi:glutathione synthase/RimK-type ligase-like ATP-grasp enzyme
LVIGEADFLVRLIKRAMYIYPKINFPEKITTNISQGGRGAPHILKFIPKRLIAKAKRAAIETARVLNLDLAGIDILLDRNHKDVYIVGVNVFPGLPKRKTFNLARAVIKELARLDNGGNLRFKKPQVY